MGHLAGPAVLSFPGWWRLPGCDLRRGSFAWWSLLSLGKFSRLHLCGRPCSDALDGSIFTFSVTGRAIVLKQVDRLRWAGRSASCWFTASITPADAAPPRERSSSSGVAARLVVAPLIPGGGA